MLTEVAHGLDSQNIETTAKLQPDGSFELHTPNAGAAKSVSNHYWKVQFLTSSDSCQRVSPREGYRDCGGNGAPHRSRPRVWHMTVRGFSLHDGKSIVFPARSGTRPVGHAITSFNHVRLPTTALVGDVNSSLRPRIQFLTSIWRLGIGSATMAALCIPGFRLGAYIFTQYAKQRTPAVFKTLSIHHYRESSITLTDRLGARGLIYENQMISFELIYSQGLASELLLGRYSLPEARYPTSPFAKHEQAIFAEMRELLKTINIRHRSEEFNRVLLPRSVALVVAIGQRMTYEAAVDSGVDSLLLEVYRNGAMIQDFA
ncbi:hypothetical protein DFH09DRAFT_1114430 [Mycena vulgaris]|nr:hypothetical protein DFH09DRAFT_1114430 [Mycena vulgaris]